MTTTSSAALEHEIGLAGLLAVRLRDGSVHLRGIDGSVVRVHDDHGEVEDAFSIDRGSGSLALRSGRPGPHGAHSPDLVIDVPRRANVVIESASGDLNADGLLGDQRFRTTSGDMVLREVGGALSIDAVSGDVEITAVENSNISARTVSGDLSVRAATIESLRLSTTSGDLRIAGHLEGPGPFSIETVNGDTLLAVAGDVRIEMQTVAGDLRSEIEARTEGGRGRRILTIGSGGPTLAVRSMSGDVRVVRALGVTRPDAPVEATGPEAPTPATAPVAPIAPTLVVANGSDPSDITDASEAARLEILRSLERGEIDVAEAGRRLESLEATTAEDPTDA